MGGLSAMLWRTVQIVVLIVLAVLLWRAADGRAALEHLRSADLRWLAVAVLVLTVQTVLSAQRWRVTAAQLGLAIPAMSALREYYLAQVVNQTLPGGVLGDASRAVRWRAQAGLRVSAQAVVFERIAGQLGLVAILGCGLAFALAIPSDLAWPVWLLRALGLGTALAISIGIGALTLPALRRAAQPFFRAVCAPEVRLQQTALSLATALCNVAAFVACAQALGIAMSVVAMAALVPLILFAMILPISVAGWGLREGAAAALFPVMGATSSEGLATSVAFGLVFLATSLPGIAVPLLAREKTSPLVQEPFDAT